MQTVIPSRWNSKYVSRIELCTWRSMIHSGARTAENRIAEGKKKRAARLRRFDLQMYEAWNSAASLYWTEQSPSHPQKPTNHEIIAEVMLINGNDG